MRGRGGGVERVLYDGLRGVVEQAIQVNLNYKKAKRTNATATPIVRDIALRDVQIKTTGEGSKGSVPVVLCEGLKESPVQNITSSNVTMMGATGEKQECKYCEGHTGDGTTPALCVQH